MSSLHVGKPVTPLAANPRRHLQRETLPLPETLLRLNVGQSTANTHLKWIFGRELQEQVQNETDGTNGMVGTVASVRPPVSLPPRQVTEDGSCKQRAKYTSNISESKSLFKSGVQSALGDT